MVSVKHIYQEKTLFGWVLSPQRPWQECLNVNSVIMKQLKKHLLSTHKYVGSRFKCNQCGQIAIQWCNLKSHKQRKCKEHQYDQCHFKPYKRNYLKSPAQLKSNGRDILRIENKFPIVKRIWNINIRSHLPKPHHITHSQRWPFLTRALVTFPNPEWYPISL